MVSWRRGHLAPTYSVRGLHEAQPHQLGLHKRFHGSRQLAGLAALRVLRQLRTRFQLDLGAEHVETQAAVEHAWAGRIVQVVAQYFLEVLEAKRSLWLDFLARKDKDIG